ncbi:random slug protein 5-like [Sesbania bispinosa]|nr:random slug protein 5-like [Sesbania bispinosa]
MAVLTATAKGNVPVLDARDIREHSPRALPLRVFYTPKEIYSLFNGIFSFVDLASVLKIRHSQLTSQD